MELGYFYVDENGVIQLNKYKMVVRDYKTVEKTDYTDTTYFMNEKNAAEWEINIIPKHQLLELVSKTEIDTSDYAWMAGIKLRTDNHAEEIAEIAAFGSVEAYEASLPETSAAYQLESDFRLAKLELGIQEV